MKAVQEVAQRSDLGQRKTQPALQATVLRQKRHVFGAIPTDGLEQEDRFDELAVAQTALAGFELEVDIGQDRNTKAAQDTGGGQQAGVG